MKQLPLYLSLIFVLSSCTDYAQAIHNKPKTLEGLSVATLAGGCFWCMESNFESVEGVKEVISGFSGGDSANPSYQQVESGKTGHTETIQVYYDPAEIDYEHVLHWYWRSIDPTNADGQFEVEGNQYRPAIFFHDTQQQQIAEQTRDEIAKSGRFDKPIIVEITAFKNFYRAEEHHQDYHLNRPARYRLYRMNTGRDEYLKKKWDEHFWKRH